MFDQEWIPLSDGTRLAATIWRPVDSEIHPVPALLEYLPYRKDDNTAEGDSRLHPYFAGHGYASVRADIRGSGNSDGVLLDEYLPLEQSDAIEVIEWLAAQSWCTGAVGMFGISWGGFNSLQVAARQPEALRAIVTMCSTDDRYATDVHYRGGCLMGDEMPSWANEMLARSSLPPDPLVVGDRWREMWLERLHSGSPFLEHWLTHQNRDSYWKQGSVNENFAAIKCPVFAVGGWADGYVDAVLRLLEGLEAPRLGLIGPWGHEYPHEAFPGPSIGFLQECLRWWDHWLKAADTGIMEEPVLRAWMQTGRPSPTQQETPGRWVAEKEWPSPNTITERFELNGTRLGGEHVSGVERTVKSHPMAGLDSGRWLVNHSVQQLPPDQRFTDSISMTFTGDPLREPVEILGHAKVGLHLSADEPNALVAVRLCDVAPDGSSTLVTDGLLNLTHRSGHGTPAAVHLGVKHKLVIPLKATSYHFPSGHRLRVGLSPSYWPRAWPSPEPVTLSVFTGPDCFLELPVRVGGTEGPVQFQPPERHKGVQITTEARRPYGRWVQRDFSANEVTLVDDMGYAVRRFPQRQDLIIEFEGCNTFTISEDAPYRARTVSESAWTIGRGDWRTLVKAQTDLRATRDAFELRSSLDAYEGSRRIFSKVWVKEIQRDCV